MNPLLLRRFEELSEQARKLEASKKREYNQYINEHQEQIDSNALLNWKVKAKSLVDAVCGPESQHAQHLRDAESGMYSTDLENLRRMKAVFEAAREDFEGGYLVTMRSLIQSEVFGSELEQATELLKSGYSVAAAVIAGVVLETTIRDLCTRNNVPIGKLDKMNADLAKAGVYNGLMQKRIIHLYGVRNSAAHGNKQEFETYDVAAMINEVERFLSQHLA